MNRIKVGIIGFGRIGNEHAGWIGQTQRVRAAVAFDPTAARRDLAKSRGLNAVDSIDAILNDRSIDAVLVSTPTSMHFDHASQALAAGKHVMVEKPMALDAQQARSLIAQSERAGKTLSVFHNRRWDIDYLTVKSAIESGVLGRVFNIESRLGQWSSCVGPAAQEWRPGWRNESRFGGGGLYDWGSHFVDQLWRLMDTIGGKPRRVFAQLQANIWSADAGCDDFARVCVDFDNGASGLVEINTTTMRPLPRWHIDGTQGSSDSPFSLAFDTREWAELTFMPATGGEARLLPKSLPGLSEPEIWDHFAAACRGESEPAVTARSVLPTMMLLDAARQSAREGQVMEVNIDPVGFLREIGA